MIRKSGECRIDVIEKVNDAAKILIVPNVFNVMVLCDIEVQANRRETASLAADVIEGYLLKIWVASVVDWKSGNCASNIAQHAANGRIGSPELKRRRKV